MDMRFSRWSAGSNRLSAQAFFWQPLHSPVSSLAVNHMLEELNEDVSPPLCCSACLVSEESRGATLMGGKKDEWFLEQTRWLLRLRGNHQAPRRYLSCFEGHQIN